MRKSLLMAASMLFVATMANAQVEVVKAKDVRLSPELSMAPVAALNQDGAALSKVSGPKKSVANGVWYGKPLGTYYWSVSYTNGATAGFLVPPMFTDINFVNQSSDVASTKWYVGETQADADADGNYTGFYGRLPENYYFYSMLLTDGSKNYELGADNNDYTGTYTFSEITEGLSQVEINGGYYSGFSDGYVFGTHDSYYIDEETEEQVPIHCFKITEFFDKPASALYLTNLGFNYLSNSATPIPSGTEMTLKIRSLDEEGNLADEIASIPFSINDTLWTRASYTGRRLDHSYGYIQVAQKETDPFGTEYEVPIILKDAFAIEIEGFNQPGVDFSLYMCEVYYNDGNEETGTPADFYGYGAGVYPTIYSYVDDEGEYVGGRSQFRTTEGAMRQFNAVFFLNGMFDVASIAIDECKNMTAPVEGGRVYTNILTTDGAVQAMDAVAVYTTLPLVEEGADEGNYGIEGIPDWLTLEGADNSDYDEYDLSYIVFTADALPSDVKGRQATLKIVSDKGAEAEFVVTQGEVESGISDIQIGSTISSKQTFNLAGQRVAADKKGLVIKNGKKFFNK